MRRMFLLLLLAVSLPLRADELSDWLAGTEGGKFDPAGPAELKAVGEEFERLFGGEADAGAWELLGFRLTRVGPFWALAEIEKRGRGAYLVRAEGGDGSALQAPHRFKDLYTGAIALRLMAEGRFSAVAWNSVPRWTLRGKQRFESDLAHEPLNHHIAFARAFARTHPRGRVVQLHGFAAEKRDSRAGRESTMIVSDGGAHPTARLLEVAGCLREAFGEGVRHYPFQVRELGGTTNVVGHRLRAAGFDGFVHLEMNKGVRERLRDEGVAREALSGCLSVRPAVRGAMEDGRRAGSAG